MKTFDQIRQELSEGYESNKIRKVLRMGEEVEQIHELKSSERSQNILKTGIGTKVGHSGHEGAEFQHDEAAKKHKGTEAGKHHAAAAQHHSNAVSAIEKGNISSAFNHSKLANRSALKARLAGGSKTDTETLHNHHQAIYKGHQRAQDHAATLADRKTKAKKDKPIQRAIGQAKTKIKRALRREDVEQVDEISDKMLARYKKKAFQQYNVSRKRMGDDGYTPAKRAQHADRFRKRSKGIGGYYQRDMAKRNTIKYKDGSTFDMGSGSKYLHKPTKHDMYSKGKKGMTMTGRPASAMPKSDQDPDRK